MQTLITVSFVGTRYHGFQVQKNSMSICEALQNSMEKIYGCRPDIKGSSRTDAGVHAIGFRVCFTQPKPIKMIKLPLSLNQYLPPDIRVQKAEEVCDEFHVRYDAVTKEYIYRILNSPVDDPFMHNQCWRVGGVIDEEMMSRAACYIVGRHDFASFMSAGSDITDTVREVQFCNVKREGRYITVHISADGYLYNMVRIIVGTIKEVGTGHRAPEDIKAILEGKSRINAGDTAPACGLYLYKVNYQENYKPLPHPPKGTSV
ncbi:MAG: tRNA pseudouridine(38-40) synthase TruA [Oscillospiraceae bacterium]